MLERNRANTDDGVILKTNKKLVKNWNELLLVDYSKTIKINQKRFGCDQAFQLARLNLVRCGNWPKNQFYKKYHLFLY